MLSLSRPAQTFAPGQTVTLTGVARRLQGPFTLEQRADGGSWEVGPAVTPSRDGSFSVEVTPESTTLYRLSTKTVKSSPLRLPVAPTPAASRALSSSVSSVRRASSAADAFTPDDPLAAQQWYLTEDRAFELWPELPLLEPVRVAVIDTGIDLGIPSSRAGSSPRRASSAGRCPTGSGTARS